MNKHRKILFFVYSSILLLIIGIFSILTYYTTAASKAFTISDNQSSTYYTAKTAYITIDSSKKWREADSSCGQQFDGFFYNTSKYPLTDWVIKIKLPDGAKIDSSWNFHYALKDNTLIATCMDYNAIIPADNFITFGFIMIAKTDYTLDDIEMTVSPLIHIYDYPIYWVLVSLSVLYLIIVIITIIVEVNLSKFRIQRITDQNIIIQSMKTFSNFIDAKDRYTNGHSVRVAYYSREIAKKMMLPSADVVKIYYVALLHDVGKISIPDAILNKPLPLTEDEQNMIKTHPLIGGQMLKDFTAIEGIREGVLYHHEYYDGSGYPEGLVGDAIPLYARIICVADSYDAMSSDRFYRNRLSHNQIVEELTRNSGVQFDPKVVECILELMKSPSFSQLHDEKR